MSDTNRRSKAYKDAMACVQFLVSRKGATLFAVPALDLRSADASGVDPFEISRAAGLDLRSFVVTAQVNRAACVFDQEIGYYNRSGLLSSGDLALMCRTLKVVGDGLGSLEEKYGATTQFGQHLARVADILSIRSYVIEPFEGGSRASVQPVSTREAIEIIDELARKIAGERLAAVPVDGTQVIN